MSWSLKKGVLAAGLALCAVVPAEAARIKVGDEVPYAGKSPAAYPAGGPPRPPPPSPAVRAEAGRIMAGDEVPYAVRPPAAYPAGGPHRPVSWSETIVSPGATFLRVHFERLEL